jgi:prefoldin subunit 5
VPKERNVGETERLDRIERHIQQLTDASAALQRELQIARQLAAERQRATRTLSSAKPTLKPGRRRRG